MEISPVLSLLNQVSSIVTQYDKIAQITGENFNVFNVLKLSTSEVRTHSALLAELLNPEGSHGQKEIFLQLFIEHIRIAYHQNNSNRLDALNNITPINAKVKVEEHRGIKTDDAGGRIDIVIKEKSSQIVIENKINAKDQDKQLIRYNNEYPGSTLLYLTLDGKEATEISVKSDSGKTLEVNQDYFTISYETDIIKWLEECKKEAVNHPLLRETISQYINLIKELTGRTMKESEIQEIINKVLKNEEQLYALEALNNNNIWDETRRTILRNLIDEKTGIGKELGLETMLDGQYQLGNKKSGFWFVKEKWTYCVYFYFEEDFDKLSYGVYSKDNDTEYNKQVSEKFALELKNLDEPLNDTEWVWKANFDEYENTSWYALSKEDGRKLFKKAISDIINKVEGMM